MSSQTNLPKDERALNALYDVIDPELNVNIVDLGLVYDITFAPSTVHVLMTLTSRFCPMGDAIKTGVINALEAEFPGEEIEIELTFEPAWNMEFVSDQGREELNNR
ncbi:metal-sulfur cluster assembly factor [Chryseobacterium sp. A321]